MKLDPVLLEILVCPDCKGSLTVDNDNEELTCTGCGLAYPVRDDIPVMLVEEARAPDRSQPSGATEGAAADSTPDPPLEGADEASRPGGDGHVDSERTP